MPPCSITHQLKDSEILHLKTPGRVYSLCTTKPTTNLRFPFLRNPVHASPIAHPVQFTACHSFSRQYILCSCPRSGITCPGLHWVKPYFCPQGASIFSSLKIGAKHFSSTIPIKAVSANPIFWSLPNKGGTLGCGKQNPSR